jgi:tRNA nucleotidyltransferase (CCA-adding enzyme)
MHIILTHEQADFDALASLLGAHLVNESAIPVMPRRMNRNVRAFVNLYGVELPFVDPRELPNEPVDKITLVDTQSMVTIKGTSARTEVQVIDHHPVREGTPANWAITSEETGATATLFTEILHEHDSLLSAIEATLLLLGIYEDTGSLTYTRTTARDLNAAAFLLERGASLEIATDFINHPLSLQQQALYDTLRTQARTHQIHGHTVVIACGDAESMDEELSTVAHKMRDLLDPDALFLLVKTRGGVQLIARSTRDTIDVAKIAEHFGGGGHERAAASLIKDQDVETAYKALVELLPTWIQPAITISQIMSPSPQLLTPQTPVEEAAQQMQRYGFEGYPVVENGKVIGLLTRRAVDRATSHQMHVTATSLMDAGEVTVYPDDPLERLQEVMTESGWGQVPVVSRETGQVIGIVTRTDLLKTLTRGARLPSFQNLAGRLETTLSPARLALLKAVADLANQRRDALYIVGGFVRDMLLDRPSLDVDLVVEGDAIELARTLAEKYGGRTTSHARFGTAKWHIHEIRPALIEFLSLDPQLDPNGKRVAGRNRMQAADLPEFLDLITARREFYTHPTALPTVERGSIKLDLHRRDFTINTLALRLDGHHYGELHDYWGGLNDLRQGIIRVLHSLSFVDDPTRMLRAIRFEQRFGFRIEDRTLQLINEARPLLGRITGDRIRHEFDHILEEEHAHLMLDRAAGLDLLSAIHPDLLWDTWIAARLQKLNTLNPPSEWGLESTPKGISMKIRLAYILWLIRLPTIRSCSVMTRLTIPVYLSDEVLAARRLWRELPSLDGLPPSQIVSRLEGVPTLALYAVYLATGDDQSQRLLWEFCARWRKIEPETSGHDLRMRGLPAGPRYKQILGTLRDAWLDGKIQSAEEEKALLEQLLTNPDPILPA